MGKLREFLANLYQINLAEQRRLVRVAGNILRFAVEMFAQINKDTVIVRASGMAYTSLLAIVPLVAVFFSIFSAFERFSAYKDQIQQWLFSQMIPTRTDEMIAYINQFAANTKALGLVSTGLLFVTSILLFDNIEKNFNALWHVEKKRNFLQRFSTFTNVLLWGPILIALSFYASTRIRLFLDNNPFLDLGIALRMVMAALPWLFSVFAFFLALLIVPATRVKMRSAMVGGLMGGTIWELAKVVFTHTTARSITYNALYGSLALIPIFLVWLYLTWIIVLLAVEASYVHHNFQALVLHRAFSKPSARERLFLAVRIYAAVARTYYERRTPPTLEWLEEIFSVPSELAGEVVDLMVETNLLRLTDVKGGGSGFLPGVPPGEVSVAEVFRTAFRRGGELFDRGEVDALDREAIDLLKLGEEAANAEYGKMTFKDLMDRAGIRVEGAVNG